MGESFIARLAPYEMQIGLEESDVRQCHGDSGGPTFLNIETTTDDAMRLIGVTSHTYDASDCARTGGVDTRVDYYVDWIDQEMRAACDDGTRVWCDEPGILVPPTTEDTGVEDVASGDDDEEKGGCGCGTTGASALPAILAGLLALRRKVGNPPRP
jgi:MYXO-CTERM domain-containing protein